MKQSRDLRIDFLRGLALITIFIDHIPETLWEQYTLQNFGFSDAAEAFVLISGISTGLAYGPAFLKGATLATALRPWRRAFTLWWVQALVVLAITVMLAVSKDTPAIAAMALERNVTPALENPQGLLLPLLFFGHQFSCADVLPLYTMLMLAAPAILALAVRMPLVLMTASVSLWALVGLWSIDLPTWPLESRWFFDPLAWQVLFVAGIVVGVTKRKGRAVLPVRPLPLAVAVLFLTGALLWHIVPAIGDWGESTLAELHDTYGLPLSLTSFDKTFLYAPRLLHVLALGYVLSALPFLHRLAASRFGAGFGLLGRNALPVFATNSVLAYLAQMIRATNPPSDWLDTALIIIGIILLLLVAKWRDAQKAGGPKFPRPVVKAPSKTQAPIFFQAGSGRQKKASPFQ